MYEQRERKKKSNQISPVKLLSLLKADVLPVSSLYAFGMQAAPKFGIRRNTDSLNINFKIKRKYTEL